MRNNFPKSKRATWSQCLKWALEQIDSDIILYLQEDYFIKGRVKSDIIDSFVELMLRHSDIKCIHLTDQSLLSSGKSEYEHLDNVINEQKYRVSCQAALWRKDELLDLLRLREDAWQFERFGSKRAAILNHRYLVVDRTWVKLNEFEIIPYIFTGIVKGRWIREASSLFAENNIQMDFSKRGFIDEMPPKTFNLRRIIRNRYNMYVIPIINWFDQIRMRITLLGK